MRVAASTIRSGSPVQDDREQWPAERARERESESSSQPDGRDELTCNCCSFVLGLLKTGNHGQTLRRPASQTSITLRPLIGRACARPGESYAQQLG